MISNIIGNEKDATVKLIYQYFTSCPHSGTMNHNLRKAINELGAQVILEEQLIENEEDAVKNKFRGSPTLLVNGIDLEGMPEPKNPAMACRLYPGGVPTKEEILIRIKELANIK